MHDSEEAQTAVRRRISVSWFKWRKLNSLLSNKAIQLKHHAKAINACIKSTMTYGAATWAITQREESLLHSCNRRMLRKMCGLSLSLGTQHRHTEKMRPLRSSADYAKEYNGLFWSYLRTARLWPTVYNQPVRNTQSQTHSYTKEDMERLFQSGHSSCRCSRDCGCGRS